jgi:hypothetical protein
VGPGSSGIEKSGTLRFDMGQSPRKLGATPSLPEKLKPGASIKKFALEARPSRRKEEGLRRNRPSVLNSFRGYHSVAWPSKKSALER